MFQNWNDSVQTSNNAERKTIAHIQSLKVCIAYLARKLKTFFEVTFSGIFDIVLQKIVTITHNSIDTDIFFGSKTWLCPENESRVETPILPSVLSVSLAFLQNIQHLDLNVCYSLGPLLLDFFLIILGHGCVGHKCHESDVEEVGNA